MYTRSGAYQQPSDGLQQHRGRSLITKILDRLFLAEDANALAHGWEIRRRRGGLVRIYRDPRWDGVSACDRCAGDGCRRCGGSGVVRTETTGTRQEARS